MMRLYKIFYFFCDLIKENFLVILTMALDQKHFIL